MKIISRTDDGLYKTKEELMQEAFKAGMLAAADIADDMVKAPYSIIAEAIRQAADES